METDLRIKLQSEALAFIRLKRDSKEKPGLIFCARQHIRTPEQVRARRLDCNMAEPQFRIQCLRMENGSCVPYQEMVDEMYLQSIRLSGVLESYNRVVIASNGL